MTELVKLSRDSQPLVTRLRGKSVDNIDQLTNESIKGKSIDEIYDYRNRSEFKI